MQKEIVYRHELKYEINYAEYLSMKQRLKCIMKGDDYAKENGKYTIRSIYFDNLNDKALREKVDGVAKREKFRIRYYNNDMSFINLEKKSKINGLGTKFSVRLSEDECRKILSGDTLWMIDSPEQLLNELYLKMKYQLLKPRVLVSYTREPYVYKAGNVRICFDSEIRSTLFHQKFLEDVPVDIDVMQEKGSIILEVKYDNYIPEVISHIIQTNNSRQQAFSKYASCRRFG